MNKVIERDFVHEDERAIISHQIATDGSHRLIDCAALPQAPGEWAGYKEIARLETSFGNYAATTDYYGDILPRVFLVSEVKMVTSDKA